MCMDVDGPHSCRRNDLDISEASGINARIAAMCADLEKQYKVYCDGIFPTLSHMLSKHVGETTRAERYENGTMTKIRIANEWAYGITENLFTTLKFWPLLKLRQNSEYAFLYITCTILRNAYCCLDANNTSQYFHCRPPTLEEYFGVEA